MTEEEFWRILHDVPPQQPIFFRLYYDEQGFPVTYSMEDLPGNYIEIDAATFAAGPLNVIVRDGKLVDIVTTRSQKLIPGMPGTQCHVNDVSIVVDARGTNWGKKIYESY